MNSSFVLPETILSRQATFQRLFAELDHPLKEAAGKLYASTDFISRRFEYFKALLYQDTCVTPLFKKDYEQLINPISLEQLSPQFFKSLRGFRHTYLIRLLLREIAGLAKTEETLASWSDCADVLISKALRYCQLQLQTQYGLPRNADGKETILYVLAMGKLGGRELNFSSDIDLIMTYSQEGETDGPEKIDNQAYFTRQIQQFIQIMQQVTPDGFVFRVDLRLRPNGDSGPLVSSLASMENYYQEQGRDWERYAMVKARVIQLQSERVPEWFERLILPFVYRRYVDFSVIESLRGMKALIEREVLLNPRLDDIKRGKGGIREIEFIIQNIQLIRGGRMPQLQVTNAVAALDRLKEEKLLPKAEGLKQAYLFLRKLENFLQMQNDQQTHSLPQDETRLMQLAFAMGMTQRAQLLEKLEQVQRIVSHAFQGILQKVDDYEDEKRVLVYQLQSLWQGHIESSMAINLLHSLGYQNAERCYQMISDFHRSPRCKRLNQAARMRLDRFMIILLLELMEVKNSDGILLEVLRLLDNIVGRSAYLALLSENDYALKELVYWFAKSPFITALLVNHPFLLEVFLEDQQEGAIPSAKQLEMDLLEKLNHTQDAEEQAEILRQFKLKNWLIIARAELNHKVNAVRVGRFLSDVAEIIVKQVHDSACTQLAEKHPEITEISNQFAILVYGKAGSCEMNYTSDLDLVFLHQVNPEHEPLLIRLTQKILHGLTTRTQSGVLYAVDTRLRPSGAAGLLVSRMDAFIDYQKNQAWVWEHQAIIKARVVVGTHAFERMLLELKKELLHQNKTQEALAQEVIAMRKKIGWPTKNNAIKFSPGGLLDLEFLVQYLVLLSGESLLAKYTHTLSLLWQLFRLQKIKSEDYAAITKAYKHFHKALHLKLLKAGHEPDLDIDYEIVRNFIEYYQLKYWE